MRKLFTAIVASVVAFAAPVQAFTSYKDAMDKHYLLDIVQETGTTVIYNPEMCNESKGLMGYYSIITNAKGHYLKDEMGLCLKNVTSLSDLYNTVRHEAIHVAQECNGGPFFPIQNYRGQLSENTIKNVSAYDKEHWGHEVEAWHGAETLTDAQVAKILIQACGLQ